MARSVAKTHAGALVGVEENGIHRFLGIPYAAPVDGAARFLPVRPVAPWSGQRDASVPGPAIPQAPDPILPRLTSAPPLTSDEAIGLNLNVWTPGVDGAARPTLVWIHGGAFRTGRGSDPWFSGTRLVAAHDVVLVSINYRLGPLGFLSLESLLGEEYETSANLGVLDVIAALEWVRDNISSFGGDPRQVTVFGESAGAGMVSVLLAAERARGLFRAAIMQSGGAMVLDDKDAAEAVARTFLEALGLSHSEAHRLRELPVETLIDASRIVIGKESWSRGDRRAFRPVVDGVVLRELPARAVANGRWARVPVVIGTNRDEGRMHLVLGGGFPLTSEDDRAVAFARRNKAAAEVLAYLRRRLPQGDDGDLAAQLLTEDRFLLPSLELAEACVAQQSPTWLYRFDWCSTALGGQLRACHALDLPFVFDNLDIPGVSAFTGEAPPAALATAMNSAWAGFARALNPSTPEQSWPPYEIPERQTMVFSSTSAVESDPAKDAREFWNQ
jgi:para-nitrobenzyl esterase